MGDAITGPIRHVAIRYGDKMVIGPMPGFRHHHILTVASQLGYPNARPGDQGFALADGSFIDRKAAATMALEAGQVSKLTAPPNLYSEDCW